MAKEAENRTAVIFAQGGPSDKLTHHRERGPFGRFFRKELPDDQQTVLCDRPERKIFRVQGDGFDLETFMFDHSPGGTEDYAG